MVNKNCQQNNYPYIHSTCFQEVQPNCTQQYVPIHNYTNQMGNMHNYSLYGYGNELNSYNKTNYAECGISNYMAEPKTLDILPKDLSPTCANIDLLFPDIEKNLLAKETRAHEQNYLFGLKSDRKVGDFPACAYSKSNYDIDYLCADSTNVDGAFPQYIQGTEKSLKSCFAEESCKYFGPNETSNVLSHHQNEVNTLPQCFLQQESNCIDNSFINLGPLNEGLDDSNGESDIIVEESEEDITDNGEDIDRPFQCDTRCFVCNKIYNPLETQFYLLSSQAPVTMSTQKPVYNKLKEIVGEVSQTQCYLCNDCLGLINNIDHLYYNWRNCQNELLLKYQKTRKESLLEENIEQIIQNEITEVKVKKSCRLRKMRKKRISNRKFHCKRCQKRFCLRDICSNHLKMHNRNKNKEPRQNYKIDAFVCSICKKMFRTKSHLVEHENFCSGKLPFECTYENCDKKFASSSKLKSHFKLKHEKKFSAICSICNIGFVKISDYKAHKSSHSTDKKFSCPTCEKSYKTLSNLNFHLKFHDKKLPFQCALCSKGFMRKEYLESHMNNHNNIKNYFCQHCDKKFVSQKNLDAHTKYHDGSLVKKTCKICGKTMTSGMEEHMRVHNNLREFECELCLLKFNTKGALSKHKKRKHSEVS